MGSTVTDAGGGYLFEDLPVDDGVGSDMDYVVNVTDTGGVLTGYWHSLGNQSQAVDDTSKSDTYGVTLSVGTPNVPTVDFGYYVDPGALGNRVWIDNDFDGIQDPTELTGIPNVEVTLTITYPNATSVTVIPRPTPTVSTSSPTCCRRGLQRRRRRSGADVRDLDRLGRPRQRRCSGWSRPVDHDRCQ